MMIRIIINNIQKIRQTILSHILCQTLLLCHMMHCFSRQNIQLPTLRILIIQTIHHSSNPPIKHLSPKRRRRCPLIPFICIDIHKVVDMIQRPLCWCFVFLLIFHDQIQNFADVHCRNQRSSPLGGGWGGYFFDFALDVFGSWQLIHIKVSKHVSQPPSHQHPPPPPKEVLNKERCFWGLSFRVCGKRMVVVDKKNPQKKKKNQVLRRTQGEGSTTNQRM